MNLRALTKDKKGFTIIEVMIVLAIAGLIMLIVFLAVPALQRNSRNTQRRSDAALVSGLIAEFVANHNGAVPTGIVNSGNPSATQILIAQDDLSIYPVSGLTISTGTTAVNNVDTIQIKTGVTCDANTLAAGSARSYSVAFAVEGSSGGTTGTAQCV